jgi:hypothetical protein
VRRYGTLPASSSHEDDRRAEVINDGSPGGKCVSHFHVQVGSSTPWLQFQPSGQLHYSWYCKLSRRILGPAQSLLGLRVYQPSKPFKPAKKHQYTKNEVKTERNADCDLFTAGMPMELNSFASDAHQVSTFQTPSSQAPHSLLWDTIRSLQVSPATMRFHFKPYGLMN